MKSVQKIDLGLTGYDELFMNDAERKENKLPRIYDIPLSEIDDFPDHPFKVKLDEDMDQLVQSIKERGIITPVTLRPKEDGRYEIVSGHRRRKACSEDDSIIFMECNEKVSKELKKDCHRKQYIRSRDAETPFQVMSYSTMTFQESEIYGEDVLEDTECNVEESVMQRMDIERVRTALKMLAPEERAIIQDFFFTESPIPVKELVEKYAMPKTSIYRKRDDALKKLKKILGNA